MKNAIDVNDLKNHIHILRRWHMDLSMEFVIQKYFAYFRAMNALKYDQNFKQQSTQKRRRNQFLSNLLAMIGSI